MNTNRFFGTARQTSHFLKTLANENRLLILCFLAEGERSVSELEGILGLRQPTLSQQLARLRADNLVRTRRNGKTIYYSLASPEVEAILRVLYDLFCTPAKGTRSRPSGGSKSKRHRGSIISAAS